MQFMQWLEKICVKYENIFKIFIKNPGKTKFRKWKNSAKGFLI